MHLYELMFIIDSDLDDETVQNVVAGVKDILSAAGGEVQEERLMGRRRLAYPVQKKTEGLFTLIHFQGPPTGIGEINRALTINDQVLRHLLIRAQPHSLPPE